MSRKRLIKANEVVPGRAYIMHHMPLVFRCTDEPGWQRGYLEIDVEHYHRATALAEALDTGGIIRVPLRRELIGGIAMWVFDSSNRVYELESSWFDEQIRRARIVVDRAQQVLDHLVELKTRVAGEHDERDQQPSA